MSIRIQIVYGYLNSYIVYACVSLVSFISNHRISTFLHIFAFFPILNVSERGGVLMAAIFFIYLGKSKICTHCVGVCDGEQLTNWPPYQRFVHPEKMKDILLHRIKFHIV